MPNHNNGREQAGYTLVELLVVISLISVAAVTMLRFFNQSIVQYSSIQQSGSNFTGLDAQAQRIGNVLRGSTDIVAASNTSLTVYAYFAPADTYVSQIKYYPNASNTALLADVTRLTSNPPTGTLIPSTLKTFTIIPNYYKQTGVNLFTYLDVNNTVLSLPLTDEHTVQSIQINLAAPTSTSTKNASQSLGLQVSLRNRKTNL